ncbi:MAG: tyrosine-type recombinase/integrase [Hyphomonadaceae bacterium]
MANSTRATISKRSVDALDGAVGEAWLWDDQLSGFGVRKLASGRKTYLVQYRTNGRSRRYKIGVHGAMTPDEARRAARVLIGDIAAGGDPAATRGQERGTPTFAAAAESYLKHHVAPKRAPRTLEAYRSLLRNHLLATLGPIRLDALKRRDVRDLHVRLQNTPMIANRALQLVSAVFNWALKMELVEERPNPARFVERYKERPRGKMLDREELRRLGAALDHFEREGGLSIYALAALRLLLMTGARLNEILTLKWAYVRFEERTLRLPDTKTGPRIIRLCPEALALLDKLPQQADNPYVICGQKAGTHLINLEKPWRLVRKHARLEDTRIHDLRHTLGSVTASQTGSLQVTGAVLGQKSLTVTQRYAHLVDKAVTSAANEAGSYVAEALSEPPLAPPTSPRPRRGNLVLVHSS